MSLADPTDAGLPPTDAERLPDDVATLNRMVLELLASCHEFVREGKKRRVTVAGRALERQWVLFG
jgi:hypothetical protein